MKKLGNFFCLNSICIILVTILSLSHSNCFSQNIYISTEDNKIFRLNADLTVTQVVHLFNLEFPIYDIAISPDNVFYGISGNNLIEIDIDNNSYSVLAQFPETSDSPYTSLVCNNVGEIFTLNNDNLNLYKYNIQTSETNLVTYIGYTTPGDLTFYEGNIIFPNFPYVTAYDPYSHKLINIFCIPPLGGLIWGITNEFTDCDSNRIIASTYDNELWQFDINSGVTNVLNFNNTISTAIFGLASQSEYLASDCSGELISVDCHVSIPEENQVDFIIYPNPTYSELNIKTQFPIQKIEFFDVNGKLRLSLNNPNINMIDIRILERGMYFLKVFSDDKISIKKIIKK